MHRRCGWAAIARVGFSSSHSAGIAAVGPAPCSGIERQAFAHCARAFCSSAGSFFIRACTIAICSATFLSISGLTCAGTLTRAPATLRPVSPRFTCAARLGSIRQAAASFGRDVMTMLPLISALALRFLMLMPPIRLAASLPSRPPMASPTAPVAFGRQRAGDVERARQRRRQRHHVLAAGCRDRSARGGPADIGILQDLRYRIVGLAAESLRACRGRRRRGSPTARSRPAPSRATNAAPAAAAAVQPAPVRRRRAATASPWSSG